MDNRENQVIDIIVKDFKEREKQILRQYKKSQEIVRAPTLIVRPSPLTDLETRRISLDELRKKQRETRKLWAED